MAYSGEPFPAYTLAENLLDRYGSPIEVEADEWRREGVDWYDYTDDTNVARCFLDRLEASHVVESIHDFYTRQEQGFMIPTHMIRGIHLSIHYLHPELDQYYTLSSPEKIFVRGPVTSPIALEDFIHGVRQYSASDPDMPLSVVEPKVLDILRAGQEQLQNGGN